MVRPKGESEREQPKSENPPHKKLGEGEGEEKAREDRRWRNGDWVESKRNDEPAGDYFAIIIERESPVARTNRAGVWLFAFVFFEILCLTKSEEFRPRPCQSDLISVFLAIQLSNKVQYLTLHGCFFFFGHASMSFSPPLGLGPFSEAIYPRSGWRPTSEELELWCSPHSTVSTVSRN